MALDLMLKIDGVPGDSMLRGWTGWFELADAQWGLEESATLRTVGEPFTFTMRTGFGVPALIKIAAKQQQVARMELQALKPPTAPPMPILKAVILGGVLDVAVNPVEDRVLETRCTLTGYTQATITYITYNAAGKGTESTAVWRA